jgi:hypothetical protein
MRYFLIIILTWKSLRSLTEYIYDYIYNSRHFISVGIYILR